MEVIGRPQSPQRRQCQERRRQRKLHPATPSLLDRSGLGHSAFAFGYLNSLLNAGQIGRQAIGHLLRVLGPIARLRRQAPLRQRDELVIRAAQIQSRHRLGEIAVASFAADFLA